MSLIAAGSAPKSLKIPSTKKANNCTIDLNDPTFRQMSLINSKDESTTDKAIFNERQDTKGRSHAARSIFSNTTLQSGITVSTAQDCFFSQSFISFDLFLFEAVSCRYVVTSCIFRWCVATSISESCWIVSAS